MSSITWDVFNPHYLAKIPPPFAAGITRTVYTWALSLPDGPKDKYEEIKSVTAQKVITGHRFPLELAAIIPNGETPGNPIKFDYVYCKNEVIPACEMFMDAVNDDPEVPENLH